MGRADFNAHPDVTILGGGLAGVSLAYFLRNKRVSYELFEKESRLGGLCRSKRVGGFTFDCCGHLLHFKHKNTFALIRELLGDNLIEHKRNAYIYSFDRIHRYPFQVNLHGLPHPVIKKCLTDFIRVHTNGIKYLIPRNFFEWSHKNFGEGVTEYFMRPYNEKFWNVKLEDLSHEWAEGLVIIPTYRQVVEGTVDESRRNLGYNASFWYPRQGGIETLVKTFSRSLPSVSVKSEVTEIDLIKKTVRFKDGRMMKFNHLASTLPLPELLKMIRHVPRDMKRYGRQLRWVSIFNINIGIEPTMQPHCHWIYFPARDICFFRAGFFHNFSPSLVPPGASSMYVEVSYSRHKPINKRTIVRQVMDDLKRVGILKEKDRVVVSNTHDIRYGYPLYDMNYRQAREKIVSFLREYNISCCGRYGSWRYMSMEDVISESRALAQEISEREAIYESY